MSSTESDYRSVIHTLSMDPEEFSGIDVTFNVDEDFLADLGLKNTIWDWNSPAALNALSVHFYAASHAALHRKKRPE